jgi:hypothetical protein
MNHRPRFRFTLRDLLALTAILAVGAGLLSMVVRRMHASTGRLSCISNQRQIGMALSNFDHAYGSYPGYRHDLAGSHVPWSVVILPHLSRQDIYDWYAKTASPGAVRHVEFFVCPMDQSKHAPGRAMSYVMNAGCATDTLDKPANGIARDHVGSDERIGLVYVYKHDGLSHTVILSENLQATQWDLAGKRDTVFLWHATTKPKAEHRINGGSRRAALTTDTARPSSLHTGFVVIGFCDGHAQLIGEAVDYKVYMQLMTPNSKDSDMPVEWKDYAIDLDTLP